MYCGFIDVPIDKLSELISAGKSLKIKVSNVLTQQARVLLYFASNAGGATTVSIMTLSKTAYKT